MITLSLLNVTFSDTILYKVSKVVIKVCLIKQLNCNTVCVDLPYLFSLSSDCVGSQDPYCVWDSNMNGGRCVRSTLSVAGDQTVNIGSGCVEGLMYEYCRHT